MLEFLLREKVKKNRFFIKCAKVSVCENIKRFLYFFIKCDRISVFGLFCLLEFFIKCARSSVFEKIQMCFRDF